MGKIRVLDEHIANQIAAGEVVERPSSVVKELVENAIDAGSTRIDVMIEEGGLGLIRVIDNGSGMERDDCEAAFFRHATSKIASSQDLFSIRTLGFRGEALPSIAAVSKVTCVTSAEQSGLGHRLVMEGGAVKTCEDTAAQRGTDIQVRDLFFNTPARLKYMKTVQTELGHVSDYIYRLSLAHPDIAFTLKHNGNLLIQTLGNSDMLQVIAAIYGSAVAKSMLPIEGEHLDYSISGFIGKPETTRANRNGISTVINGRYIRNYTVIHALLQGYHTLLPINRFPVAAVHVRMDPTLVDVNVHPAKLEVRFSKEQELIQFVEQQVRRVLNRQVLIPGMGEKTKQQPLIQEQMELYRPDAPQTATAAGLASANLPASPHQPAGDRSAASARSTADETAAAAGSGSHPNSTAADERSLFDSYGGRPGDAGSAAGTDDAARLADYRTTGGSEHRSSSTSADARGSHSVDARARAERERSTPNRAVAGEEVVRALHVSGERDTPSLPAFPRLSAIGQMHGTYIIAQNEEGLFLIDQHAAHERINYEYYYEKFGQPAEASQELLVPITVEFTPSEAERLKDKIAVLQQAGVYMEPFGGNAYLVRAYPHWFPPGEEKALVEEMIEWLLTERKTIDLGKLREKAAIMCSCKASIKANQGLSTLEIEALLDRLAACRNPYTCPHGRPIVISFSTYELEKMFKRVM
ncbi:DNA mismatch repair endonuclease MutL [Paenibacillus xerothermodurans]|uniref:DNA mismatch repair protein MutL n=1 Tax=Paenibacillus xerothermodurans TaxID=1977292 RepID=A0A2W1NVW3_PAEXE|nr:DNA mismatch repair endonuclease MutL [Paenibacillus xerothermodurans]PZE21856.1 DNA mismatch repair endonuclease MutL [Paenibacillus xerothermodurans]